MTGPLPLTCRCADIALIGVAINLLVLVAAPLLRPDLDLLQKSLSYYAVGPWGVVQAIAFIAFAVASVALGIALLKTRGSSVWTLPVVLLLVVSGAASLGLVWYPMGSAGPASILGDAHQSAGTVCGVAQLAAALAFALTARAEPAWSGLFTAAVTLFVVALTGALLSQVAIWWPDLGIPMGATMRLLAVPLVALWGLVAWRLRRTCGESVSQSAAVR